jgi:plasmid maintenance system antidote protein VapI
MSVFVGSGNTHERSINAETAFAFGLFSRMDPQFRVKLQGRFDHRRVELEKAASIRARVQPLAR